jgi:hypothetical protein
MVQLADLTGYVMIFALVGIMSMISLYVVASVYGTIPTSIMSPAGTGANPCTAGNITICGPALAINNTIGNTSSGYSTIMGWLPIIAVVLAAAIVLGLLLHDLFGTGRSG